MARKEYMMVDIVDILRRCQKGDGIRPIARATGMGRNTVKSTSTSLAGRALPRRTPAIWRKSPPM